MLAISNRQLRRAGVVFFAKEGEDDDEEDDESKGGGGDDAAWQALLTHFKAQNLTPAQIRSRFDNSRKWEKQAKDNAAAAAKLIELEGANKSDAEKTAERIKVAEEKAAENERQLLRLRIASRKGLSESQARRLVGETEEELEADADELLETFSPNGNGDGNKEKKTPPGKPRENLKDSKPGSSPNAKPEELDPAKLAELVPRNRF